MLSGSPVRDAPLEAQGGAKQTPSDAPKSEAPGLTPPCSPVQPTPLLDSCNYPVHLKNLRCDTAACGASGVTTLRRRRLYELSDTCVAPP